MITKNRRPLWTPVIFIIPINFGSKNHGSGFTQGMALLHFGFYLIPFSALAPFRLKSPLRKMLYQPGIASMN